MRGTILGSIQGVAGGAILPRGTGAAPPVWSIAGTTQITEDAANATYTVSYANSLAPGQSATIGVASAAGTASDGADYTGIATTLTFTAGGATAKTLAATVIEDTIIEGTEDFAVTLAGQSIGTIGASRVNTMIVDEDATNLQWSVSGPTAIDEGDAGGYTVSYTGVTLAPGQQATITVASAAGVLSWPDATAGGDYTALSTVLTFTGGGSTEKTVAVSTIDDTDVETTEDFRVTIGGQSIGSLAASQANTVILTGDSDELLLDVVSGAVQAYSMRKLRAAYAGNCIRLRRDSDNAESDFGFDGSGNLDSAAIASWLGGASGFVVAWYDQSGNADHATQATAAAQPVYIASGINSLPTLDFVPNDALAIVGPVAHGTWTTLAVCIYEASNTIGYVITDSGANRQHRLRRSTAKVDLFAGATLSLSYGGNYSLPHLFEWENRGSNAGEIWVDGASLGTGDPGTGTLSCDSIGNLGSNFFDGKITEIIVFGANISSGNRAIAEADIMAYWGLSS